jgi:hypothetical protein
VEIQGGPQRRPSGAQRKPNPAQQKPNLAQQKQNRIHFPESRYFNNLCCQQGSLIIRAALPAPAPQDLAFGFG